VIKWLFYKLGFVSIVDITRELISEYALVKREAEEIPKQLTYYEWYLILVIIYNDGVDSKNMDLYNRIYYSFTEEEIEKVNDAAIIQNLINEVNNGEI